MTRMKKLLCILLIVAMFTSMLATGVFAVGTVPSDDADIAVEDQLSELSARNAVTRYFQDRSAFLQNEIDNFTTAVTAMVTDESAHKACLRANGITFIDSTITIDNIYFNDWCTDVDITETITYSVDEATCYALVSHEVIVYLDENGAPIVASDAYQEDFSNFASCSAVLPVEDTLDPTATGGSRFCIINIANGEIGYTETGNNVTKYGAWYGLQDEWCAMFVSWCANQASVSTTIIPKTASPSGMKNTFSQNGYFYLSKSQGGTTTPQAGDLFFEGTSSSNISHVGIISSVDSSNIYVIDGNCENKVNSHSLSLTASNFVGFARPQYASTNHAFYTSNGYDICSICHLKRPSVSEYRSEALTE